MRVRLSIILLFVLVSVSAQDLPDLTNYQHNWLIFNPAFTGSRDVMSMSFFSKDKAILHPGTPAPKYFQFALHTPFKNSENNAWGFSYFNQKEPGLGIAGLNLTAPVPMIDHNFSGYYAHKVRIGGGLLSLGVSGTISNERVDNSELDIRQFPDPQFLVDIEPVWNANFGAGALYYTSDFFAALSVPRLLSPVTLIDNNTYSESDPGELSIDSVLTGSTFLNYNFMLTAGQQFEISSKLTIYPSFLAGYIPAAGIKNINYMASLNIGVLNEKVWFGAIYKSGNELSVNLNLEIFDSKALLGVSWDFPLSGTTGYFDNAFEIILRYDNITKVVTKAPFYF